MGIIKKIKESFDAPFFGTILMFSAGMLAIGVGSFFGDYYRSKADNLAAKCLRKASGENTILTHYEKVKMAEDLGFNSRVKKGESIRLNRIEGKLFAELYLGGVRYRVSNSQMKDYLNGVPQKQEDRFE